MTPSIRILLSQIATFEQQHRAGINPGCGALMDFFTTAAEARLDVAGFDAGLTAPAVRPEAPVAARTGVTLECVGEVRVPSGDVARFAKALLDALERAPGVARGA